MFSDDDDFLVHDEPDDLDLDIETRTSRNPDYPRILAAAKLKHADAGRRPGAT